jgi:hypothetical protein
LISTEKHLAYTHGYLELGLLAAARAELTHLPVEAFVTPPVLIVRLEIAMAESVWTEVLEIAPALVQQDSSLERPWTAWAFALRELDRILEAQETLLTGARLITRPSVLVDYNLACYACLLGELTEARRLLASVCARDKSWREVAQGDSDLAAIFKPRG